MSSGDLTAYVDAVRTLWPEGPGPRLARRGTTSSGRPGWLVVPDPERPRMLVPADHPAAAAAAMMRFSSALGVADRVKRIGGGVALRATRGALLGTRLEAGDPSGSLLEELSASAGQELVTTMTLGTARANRKPVLQLFTTRGRGVAFAKVGLTEQAKVDVRTEHENLRTLEGSGLPDFLHVPRVLAFQEWRGLPTLVMSQLRTPAVERRLTRSDDVFAAMDRFARHFDGGTMPLPEVPLWKTLTATLDDVADEHARAQLHTAMERLAEQAGTTPLAVGAWHGDWAPWNMSRTRAGLQLWDWERFETGVPVGFDRCHFGINTALVARGLSTDAVRQGLTEAGFASDGRDPADRAVVGLYLVAILHRYLRGTADVPARVQERVQLFRDVLADWVETR